MKEKIFLSFLLVCLAFAYSRAQQSATISGSVSNQNGKPMQGATVAETDGKNQTLTDDQGMFKLTVTSQKGSLTVSYIGYNTTVVPLKNQTIIRIVMSETSSTLDDVVVIGYGTVRKSDLTGSVGAVKESQLRERPAASIAQGLSGRIAGVQVNSNSGRPGGRTNVRIRGFSSINTSNNPLFVVDGVAMPVGIQVQATTAIDYLNPSDIVSIEVLKDASSTAI